MNEWRRGYQHVGLRIRTLFCQTFHYHATTAFNIAYGNAGRFGERVKLHRYQLLSPSCSPSMEYTVTTDSAHDGALARAKTDSRASRESFIVIAS